MKPKLNLRALSTLLLASIFSIGLVSGKAHSSTVIYEDAEDGQSTGWTVYDSSPDGATISVVTDAELGSSVIELDGAGARNGFRLGGNNAARGGWNDATGTMLSWRMRTSDRFFIYVTVATTAGTRFLTYEDSSTDRGIVGEVYLRNGLGPTLRDGNWHVVTRDLAADLAAAEPDNTLLAVNGFLVRGSVSLDDIILSESDAGSGDTENENITNYEDAEDGQTTGWELYDATPEGASISVVTDAELGSSVIDLSGSGIENGFRLGGNNSSNGGWNDSSGHFLSWRMRTSGRFFVYVSVATTSGTRLLTYDDSTTDRGLYGRIYVHTGLGPVLRDGNWHIVSRNLSSDLAAAEPGNTLLAVNGFLVRGSMRLDDILVSDSPDASMLPPTVEPPASNLTPDLNAYKLVFNDEFSGTSLNPNKWHTSLLWGPYWPINREEQIYVDTLHMHSELEGTASDPFELTGSTLKINATPTSASLPPPPRPPRNDPLYKRKASTYRYGDAVGTPGEPGYRPPYDPDKVNYLSGIITSYESFKMTHGYVEARAKLPAGQGLWPAFWMLPTHYVEAVPEIDVMEFLGQDVDRIYNTYHFFDVPAGWQLRSTPSFPVYATDWTQDFHTFGMAWSPKKIVWYVDGVETHSITDETVHAASGAKFKIASQAMYLIANLAVGGSWPGTPDDTTEFPATYEIDYIRAYKKKTADPINLSRDYQLMFGDEFNGSSLDPLKWESHFIWGPYLPINNEEQYYVDALYTDADLGYTPFVFDQETIDGENVKYLSITARTAMDPAGIEPPDALPDENDPIWTEHKTFNQNDSYEPQSYTSGLLTSYQSFRFAKGYAEVRARVPKGDGLWPAFWLLNRYYISQQPEIDILEVRGRRPDQAIHNYHRYPIGGGPIESDEYTTTYGTRDEGYSDGFHTFGARWRPGRIDWYVDGVREHSYIGDDVGYQLMYVLVNLAVGGGFDPGAPPNPEEFPKTFDIDYIRVYQEKDTP